jgi:hypothetical protein
MSNFSRTAFPNGGWQYYHSQSKWSAPNPKGNTFDQQVNEIIKHRRLNPAMLIQHKLSIDPVIVGNELEAYNRARLGIPAILPAARHDVPPPESSPLLSVPVRDAISAVKKIAAGAALLMEWEESGLPPEPAAVSEARAVICATCPKNEKGKSLTEIFTVPASNRILDKLKRLHDLNLKTSKDADLAVCQACLCPLKLKVHTPMSLIQKRTKPEQRAELHPQCWILAAP